MRWLQKRIELKTPDARVTANLALKISSYVLAQNLSRVWSGESTSEVTDRLIRHMNEKLGFGVEETVGDRMLFLLDFRNLLSSIYIPERRLVLVSNATIAPHNFSQALRAFERILQAPGFLILEEDFTNMHEMATLVQASKQILPAVCSVLAQQQLSTLQAYTLSVPSDQTAKQLWFQDLQVLLNRQITSLNNQLVSFYGETEQQAQDKILALELCQTDFTSHNEALTRLNAALMDECD